MFAYVYCRVQPGKVKDVLKGLRDKPGIRRAVAVTGDWDVLVALTDEDHPDTQAVGKTVLEQIQPVQGILRTYTAFAVSLGRLGIGGGPRFPLHSNVGDCYVHLSVQPGKVKHVIDTLRDLEGVKAEAAIAGRYDIIVEVPGPWDDAAGVIIDKIGAIPGVLSTSTFINLASSDDPNL
jgi:DNA-binding Lrp family transcriptional regulator